MKYFYPILLVIVLTACNKHKWFDVPHFYSDDFEAFSTTDSLLVPGDRRWSFTQLTRSANTVNVDSTVRYNGKRSLKFAAQKSDANGASKASIVKQHMAFWEGETVRLSGWFYIADTLSHEWLFLMDLEEQTAVGAGPGMRLALVNNALRVEYKFNEKDILQNASVAKPLPRRQWVHLVWEVSLSQKKNGKVKLYQDNELIIDAQSKKTLPTDVLYFQQGTKGQYSSCEIGITANSSDNPCTLYVDDVKFERVNP